MQEQPPTVLTSPEAPTSAEKGHLAAIASVDDQLSQTSRWVERLRRLSFVGIVASTSMLLAKIINTGTIGQAVNQGAKNLGFDPDNPIIEAIITNIVQTMADVMHTGSDRFALMLLAISLPTKLITEIYNRIRAARQRKLNPYG